MSNIFKITLMFFIMTLSISGQNEDSLKNDISEMKDQDLLITLESKNRPEATKSAIEIFKRGERMIPFLMKMKGNHSISQAYCLGDPLGAMGTSAPVDEATVKQIEGGIRNGRYVTVEVVSLYLISAIFYNNLAFAQVPYLIGNKPVKEKRYNTPERIFKAWSSTENWYKKLKKQQLKKLQKENIFPLKSTEIHFYGTEPLRKRSLLDCLN